MERRRSRTPPPPPPGTRAEFFTPEEFEDTWNTFTDELSAAIRHVYGFAPDSEEENQLYNAVMESLEGNQAYYKRRALPLYQERFPSANPAFLDDIVTKTAFIWAARELLALMRQGRKKFLEGFRRGQGGAGAA